jgi:hypothetical protein
MAAAAAKRQTANGSEREGEVRRDKKQASAARPCSMPSKGGRSRKFAVKTASSPYRI